MVGNHKEKEELLLIYPGVFIGVAASGWYTAKPSEAPLLMVIATNLGKQGEIKAFR